MVNPVLPWCRAAKPCVLGPLAQFIATAIAHVGICTTTIGLLFSPRPASHFAFLALSPALSPRFIRVPALFGLAPLVLSSIPKGLRTLVCWGFLSHMSATCQPFVFLPVARQPSPSHLSFFSELSLRSLKPSCQNSFGLCDSNNDPSKRPPTLRCSSPQALLPGAQRLRPAASKPHQALPTTCSALSEIPRTLRCFDHRLD